MVWIIGVLSTWSIISLILERRSLKVHETESDLAIEEILDIAIDFANSRGNTVVAHYSHSNEKYDFVQLEIFGIVSAPFPLGFRPYKFDRPFGDYFNYIPNIAEFRTRYPKVLTIIKRDKKIYVNWYATSFTITFFVIYKIFEKKLTKLLGKHKTSSRN